MGTSFTDIPIGMALALETIASPNTERISNERPIPEHDLSFIQGIKFDLFSITRDVIREMDATEVLKGASHAFLKLETVIDALEDIPDLAGTYRFINTYQAGYYKHPVEFKDGSSAKAKNELLKTTMKLVNAKVEVDDISLANVDDILVYSHHPYWMATISKLYGSIHILESHTGKILHKQDLGKKYKKSTYYDREKFPLVNALLRTLGDGELIESFATPKEIGEISTKWDLKTPETTIIGALMKANLYVK